MQRVVAIIPARYNSTRFPGKPLASLKGKTLIQHVYAQASAASLVDYVAVATDDRRIFDAVAAFGGNAVMTSGTHKSGTDRIAEAAGHTECEIVINVQGDEPFIKPEMIDDVVNLLYNDERASIGTLAKKITDINEILSPHVVKVVMDNEGFALYFSRSPIPYYRNEWKLQNTEHRTRKTQHINTFELQTPDPEFQKFNCYKHIGIYGYRKDALISFSSMSQSRLEQIEKLEQLRALSAGMKIKVKETEFDTFGIDTTEDLRKAEEWQSISL
ncbi:MAG TPA: 3-deoxy-manno-octulosonate cytidylyltransferase [Nitrospirae bacterium]|nr:3-deoxy-manno-octulosonate cytidylyltransferase [bacterium BMS3Abin06]HDH11549.1 3-deoxy-manno-octulosonate cytidylyltransferase [Nitrospirota bacterium]HDL20854.1 3-deoxy-manno-octulosonate cytidylyltransferase [Nitrospirota bacterium]HDZ00617.1 3-deoxy-manno-octulosonate cytidylyltransferase [Nitrospirota bacterium]